MSKLYRFRSVSATVIYYVPGPFGPLQRTAAPVTFFTENQLRSAIRNADAVLSRCGAGHIVLDRDRGLAVQVSGYNGHRGAYVDVLTADELAPFLD